MLVPIKNRLKDGGSIEYKAILYKYTKIHRLSERSATGYEDGWELKILGKHAGGVINTYVETIPIQVVKNELEEANKYNIYLENTERTIYLSSAIEEVYYYTTSGKNPLKYYLTNTYQTIDDGIKHITDMLENTETLRDGGTKIYKSKKYNLTIINCNTLEGNKDIFIGDYNMNFDNETMCKR